jgi:hypothetical protein
MMTGALDVLSCGRGHTELRFDSEDPIEVERARRAVQTLMRCGCVLFVEVSGRLRRVQKFDPSTDCYIIADVPDVADAAEPSTAKPPAEGEPNVEAKPPEKKKRGRPKKAATKAVPAKSTKAIAVPMRSAG